MSENTGAVQVSARTEGPVHVIGAGLLGTSLALALRKLGVEVTLEDTSPTVLGLAIEYGAGRERARTDGQPQLVVVATPPDVVPPTVVRALERFPEATVTDLASVKLAPLTQIQELTSEHERYIGSHPMAGRERSGAIMARADLFVGRPWVICAHATTPAHVRNRVEALALDLQATVTYMDAREHDEAVALISHLPQLLSSALASQLVDAKGEHISLAGAGIRDMTRIAASDANLWVQIVQANRDLIAPGLRALQRQLGDLADALESENARPRAAVADLLQRGNTGVKRIPGKHGESNRFTQLTIIVDDTGGQLAKLFAAFDSLAISVEDVRLEHSPGARIGFVEVSIDPRAADRARRALTAAHWKIL